MSRRHHGRPHHGRVRQDGPRTSAGAQATPGGAQAKAGGATPASRPPAAPDEAAARIQDVPSIDAQPQVETRPDGAPARPLSSPSGDRTPAPSGPPTNGSPTNGSPTNGRPVAGSPGASDASGCTAPQLRRFIKSRPYVPMHELRRRFAIEGGDDDVTQVRMDVGHVYVGLPSREGALLGELLRGGEIGYELSLDPRSPIVVGVYPMRPVPRG